MITTAAPARRTCRRAPRSLADVKVTYTYVEISADREYETWLMMHRLLANGRTAAATPRTSHA